MRQRIGYVSQSTPLLSETISDNVRYGNLQASEDQVIRQVKAAGIHEFVTGLPQRYAAPVDEPGVNLSEGQKQHLPIARAPIKDRDVLVPDEPADHHIVSEPGAPYGVSL